MWNVSFGVDVFFVVCGSGEYYDWCGVLGLVIYYVGYVVVVDLWISCIVVLLVCGSGLWGVVLVCLVSVKC